jgi:dihydropyrimidine dehydrogenase (NAD+) subunit PreA/dihydroorotate dehydrogenase (NAD+) catalytic subunit
MNVTTDLGPITLKNPLICASSEFTMTAAGIKAALDAGAAAVVAKSVNESPQAARQLDSADYVLLDQHWQAAPWGTDDIAVSLFCRSGLAQLPLPEWLRLVAEADTYAQSKGAYVVGSITVADPDPAAEIAAAMEAAGLRWIELNLSAPHGREAAQGAIRQITEGEMVREYVRRVRTVTSVPLAVKLTAQTSDLLGLAEQAVQGGADMLVLIGRVQGFLPDIETHLPVLGSWGAIGGRWALPTSLYWVSKCWRALPHTLPLVGTNGARCADDVIRFLLSGARAVEFASLVLNHGPQVFARMLTDLQAYGQRKGISCLADLVGKAAEAALTYASLPVSPRTAYPWDRYLAETD